MPPSGTGWTPEQEELAFSHQFYADYVAAGGTKSNQAWASKRKKLKYLEPAVEPIPIPLPDRGDAPIDQYYQAVKSLTTLHLERVERERFIEWEPDVPGWIGIVFLGDIHIGGPIQYEQLESDLELIQQTTGCYAVGMGDYSENFAGQPKLLKAMAETVVPDSDVQMELVHHVLSRLDKWALLILGNHDGWMGAKGIEELADSLGAAFATEAGASLKCNVGRERYTGYIKHQWKGHSNLNTSNESRRMWNEFPDFDNADFTVVAHYHQPDMHSKEIKGSTVTHLRGGTYKVHDEYAAKGGFKPAYGLSMVLLNPDDHEVIPWHGPTWRRGIEMLSFLRSKLDSEGSIISRTSQLLQRTKNPAGSQIWPNPGHLGKEIGNGNK